MDNINGLMVPLIEDNIIRVLDKEKGSILMPKIQAFQEGYGKKENLMDRAHILSHEEKSIK